MTRIGDGEGEELKREESDGSNNMISPRAPKIEIHVPRYLRKFVGYVFSRGDLRDRIRVLTIDRRIRPAWIGTSNLRDGRHRRMKPPRHVSSPITRFTPGIRVWRERKCDEMIRIYEQKFGEKPQSMFDSVCKGLGDNCVVM